MFTQLRGVLSFLWLIPGDRLMIVSGPVQLVLLEKIWRSDLVAKSAGDRQPGPMMISVRMSAEVAGRAEIILPGSGGVSHHCGAVVVMRRQRVAEPSWWWRVPCASGVPGIA